MGEFQKKMNVQKISKGVLKQNSYLKTTKKETEQNILLKIHPRSKKTPEQFEDWFKQLDRIEIIKVKSETNNKYKDQETLKRDQKQSNQLEIFWNREKITNLMKMRL